ncbi:MAG: hypothetical protein ABSG62_22460 [Terracidiphilus sp.]
MKEIKKVAKVDPVSAADGAVILMERIWPALECVDSSSGAIGSTAGWTLTELLPIVIDAPADRKTRDLWLDRLYQAILEDGVDFLWLPQERWGQLCGSVEVSSQWVNEILPLLKAAWTDPRPGGYVRETCMCLSSLLAAGRHEELFDLLALQRFPYWSYRKFGVQALCAEGRIEEALPNPFSPLSTPMAKAYNRTMRKRWSGGAGHLTRVIPGHSSTSALRPTWAKA